MTTEKKTEKREVITSPEMELIFSALGRARKNSFTGELEYSVRGEVDGNAKGAEEFKKQLKKINKALVVTEDEQGNSIVKKEGNYIVNARSRNAPRVFDKKNQLLPEDEIPMIESGTVRLLVTPFEGKSGKGGGINLAGVQLLDITEYVGAEPIATDELEAALKATHN